MRRILLFAYGTLLDEKVQRRVFGRVVVETVPARLAGWRVVPRAVLGRYPGIVKATGEATAGALLRLDSRELAKADAYEDAPKLYRRRRVNARAGRQAVRVWVYVPSIVVFGGVACDPRPGLAGRR
jgi:gamma-glutamylcyclotransferase (GGCT)/AIG2-like uncharacterized protein YtfP